MKIGCSTVSISTVFLSLWLAMTIPMSLNLALAWKYPDSALGHDLLCIGIANMGLATTGLIVLWIGYRKRERWAWCVMLVILLSFILPFSMLPELRPMLAEIWRGRHSLDLLGLFRGAWQCRAIFLPSPIESAGMGCFAFGLQIQLLFALAGPIALFLPVKAFFWRPAKD